MLLLSKKENSVPAEFIYYVTESRMSALGHSLPMYSAPVPINVRYASDSDQIADAAGCRLSAKSGR